ncbi:hypothetical protein [Arcobacter sp. FWKO B]|uniref:hypothetical protein n=1 Tax=Arcobacter sp. FWKO B TaxID=2593672 RepID=UPI0018A44EA9|nr:hypothetical protein [Arcobacter sp. FWKO B]QOG12047.1 hypothetical protein FWKOB_04705 [Arcobacter sp. FWKO B]
MNYIIFGGFLFLTILLLLILKLSKKDKKSDIITQLKSLDFKDGKTSAYAFTKLGRKLELGEREQRLFDEAFEMLKEYKYKPQSKPIDTLTIAKIEIFIQSVE